MTHIRYLVTEQAGKWKINLGKLIMGSFTNRLGAISAAIDMADRDGRNGGDSQVLVRREQQELLIEWTYGRDPYPEHLEFESSIELRGSTTQPKQRRNSLRAIRASLQMKIAPPVLSGGVAPVLPRGRLVDEMRANSMCWSMKVV